MENLEEEDALQPKEVAPKRTCCESIKYVVKNITVEPTMSMLVIASLLTMLTTQNLALEKACRVNLNFSDDVCNALKQQDVESENAYEREVQQLIAKFMGMRTYITATIPSAIALFAGSYSDRTGRRKLFLIVPLVGQILMCINNMLNVYFFHQLNLEFLTFSEALLEGFSGGWSVPFFTMFAYLSTITTERTRTFRMGLLTFALSVGFPIGMGLSGILIKKLGYYGAYSFALAVHVVNLTYNIFILKEAPRTLEQKETSRNTSFCSNFFRLGNLKDSFRVVFRSGPNNRRLRMLVYMAVTCILFGPTYGEMSVLYLYTRYRFNWDELNFSIFQSYNSIIHTIGTVFSITVFSKILGWHDSMLGIISTVSKICSSFVFCFAPTGQIFFVAPAVEILGGTSLLAMKSIVSKFVDQNELGKVNSLMSLTENLMPLLYVPLYTNVYKATMDVLPGAIFLLGPVLILPALLVYIWLFYEHRKGVRRIKRENEFKKRTERILQPN